MYALESAIAVCDASGKIVQYRGLMLDVTETRRVQNQLQRERDFNIQILNNTQNMIVVADTAGLISYANRRCYQDGQFRHDALVGSRMVDWVDSSSRDEWERAFQLAILGDATDNLEIEFKRGSQGAAKFTVNFSPMRGDDGMVNSVVMVMADITELAAMQAQLMNTEKMAAVGQLVSGVAHEVNNPLTAIMGFADLMLENPELPESVHQDLRVIIQEAQRTKEIVQNLLGFARQLPAQRRPLDVNDIISRTLQLRAYDLASHGVEVKTDLAEDLPTFIGDGQQLQQVFLNILNNAHDAIRENTRPGRITLESRVKANKIEVTFRDNGPGIRNPERILEPFFTTKEVGKGTGLGLSICYGILREHGGELLFGNNLDAPGAYFKIVLPLQLQEIDAGPDVTSMAEEDA